ncbi:MAG TPA: glucose 1-dehydrogenase [Kofleriaceae bacterium]
MDIYRLEGRKALVTGGARGFGAGIAHAFVRAGADVVIADILDKEGAETAAALSSLGKGKAVFVHHDVTDDASWERTTAATVQQLGGYDLLVNNAGIEVTALVIDIDAAQLEKMLQVNIVGTALGMKHAFRAMKPNGPAGKGGGIVNIASVAATIAFPGIAGYSATKSAVDRLTRIAAMESGKLGYGVRVNCVYPGLVATEMGLKLANDMVTVGLAPDVQSAVGGVIASTPLGRLGEVADMADAIVFLASDAARFITGTGLSIDGGMGM